MRSSSPLLSGIAATRLPSCLHWKQWRRTVWKYWDAENEHNFLKCSDCLILSQSVGCFGIQQNCSALKEQRLLFAECRYNQRRFDVSMSINGSQWGWTLSHTDRGFTRSCLYAGEQNSDANWVNLFSLCMYRLKAGLNASCFWCSENEGFP